MASGGVHLLGAGWADITEIEPDSLRSSFQDQGGELTGTENHCKAPPEEDFQWCLCQSDPQDHKNAAYSGTVCDLGVSKAFVCVAFLGCI